MLFSWCLGATLLNGTSTCTTQHPLISPAFSLPPENLCPLGLSYPPPSGTSIVLLRALFWNRKFAIYSHGYTCVIPRAHRFGLTSLDLAFVFHSPAAPHGHTFLLAVLAVDCVTSSTRSSLKESHPPSDNASYYRTLPRTRGPQH